MPLFSKKITPTEITDDIERATNTSTRDLDWALVFKLCESVNSTELGAKEARKLLQKKMLSNEPSTQLLALEILNALSENCTDKMRPQLTAKSFGEDIFNLAVSKATDRKVYGKLAQCLDNWVRLSNGASQFSAINKAYNAVMSGSNGKVLTTPRREGITREGRMPRGPVTPEEIRRDIEVAKNSAQLFSQTLSFTDPTQEDISANELIQEFRNNCRRAQQLLASHLEICEDSDLLSDLINTNNELLSCFKSYDEMLEQHAVNEATINSQKLHDRNTRSDEQQKQQHQPVTTNSITGEASSTNPFQQHATPQQLPIASQTLPNFNRVEPFDPFADTNEIDFTDPASASNHNNGTSRLPPPLTPQKLHD